MTISATAVWFIAAVIVLGTELMIGTIYLIAVAVGIATAGAASWMGMSFSIQLIVCAAVILVLSALIRMNRKNAQATTVNQNLDAGHLVTVEADALRADGTAEVNYRGARWVARLSPKSVAKTLSAGIWCIDEVDGAELLLVETAITISNPK